MDNLLIPFVSGLIFLLLLVLGNQLSTLFRRVFMVGVCCGFFGVLAVLAMTVRFL